MSRFNVIPGRIIAGPFVFEGRRKSPLVLQVDDFSAVVSSLSHVKMGAFFPFYGPFQAPFGRRRTRGSSAPLYASSGNSSFVPFFSFTKGPFLFAVNTSRPRFPSYPLLFVERRLGNRGLAVLRHQMLFFSPPFSPPPSPSPSLSSEVPTRFPFLGLGKTTSPPVNAHSVSLAKTCPKSFFYFFLLFTSEDLRVSPPPLLSPGPQATLDQR